MVPDHSSSTHRVAAAPSRVLVVVMALALADTSIVTLALPQLENDLHTTVTGVAAVLFAYAAVLAMALVVVGRTMRSGVARQWVLGGCGLMAGASLACAAAGRVDVLLAARALQATGAAAVLVGGFALIDGAGRGRRAWRAASIVGIAVGPALGGALTQLFDWRAIFVAQVPVALAGACAALPEFAAGGTRERRSRLHWSLVETAPAPELPRGARAWSPARVALALVSAALSAVLFLVVLLVVAGWNVSPLSAAAAVTPFPLAAALSMTIRGSGRARAAAGCALVGAGVLALAWIPSAHLAWIVPPEIIAGLGMGSALGALSGELLPERTPREAAGLLSVRHAGVAVVLVLLASIIAGQLTAATHTAELQGVALVLDSPLSPQSKLTLVPELRNVAGARDPRASLRTGLAGQRHRFSGADLAAFDQLAVRADDTVVAAVQRSFHLAFVLAGALAFLAAALVLLAPAPGAPGAPEPGPPARAGSAREGPPRTGSRRRDRALAPALIAVAALCVATPIAYAALDHRLAPAAVELGNPCSGGPSPSAGGLGGLLQQGALALLDATACHLHTSREELVLALTDPAEAARFASRHPAFNLQSITQLLAGLVS